MRVNERIRVLKVLVIDDEGKKVGLMMTRDAVELVAKRLSDRGMKLGEHGDLGEKAVKEILAMRV